MLRRRPAMLILLVGLTVVAAGAVFYVRQRRPQANPVAGYKKWHLVTTQPYRIPAYAASLCAWPGPGPHVDYPGAKYVRVFVNPVAVSALLNEKNTKFPVGSIIVKEKLPTPKSELPELSTVMIKRAAGYNPKEGDWEYMVVNGDVTEVQAAGKLKNCIRCHSFQSDQGFVFRTYLSKNPNDYVEE